MLQHLYREETPPQKQLRGPPHTTTGMGLLPESRDLPARSGTSEEIEPDRTDTVSHEFEVDKHRTRKKEIQSRATQTKKRSWGLGAWDHRVPRQLNAVTFSILGVLCPWVLNCVRGAAALTRQYYGVNSGVNIHCRRNIPAEAAADV